MRRLRTIFILLVAALSVLWLSQNPPGAWGEGFWVMRKPLIYYTGILALGMMSLGVILAARPARFEGALGGLDKFYRLHKWLGLGGVALALTHWLLKIVPPWMAAQGWTVRPPRVPAPAGQAALYDPFQAWHGVAKSLGEWGLYALLLLAALALYKRFPYRHFFRTHRLMPALYLVFVFHAVVLMAPAYWRGPIGPVMAVVMAAGGAGALLSLLGLIGRPRQAAGRIARLERFADNAVMQVDVQLETRWPGHKAGQFAFVAFDRAEGAHPFTISSAWRDDGLLRFSIKGLGDYTRSLPARLRVGDGVTVEGPYGRFDFRANGRPQILVAGGIGITPFLARLQDMAAARSDGAPAHEVDLVYSTNAPDPDFIGELRALAERARVGLHVLVTQRDGKLSAERLVDMLPRAAQSEVWFCGPAGFGQALREGLAARGMPPACFHQELFEMR